MLLQLAKLPTLAAVQVRQRTMHRSLHLPVSLPRLSIAQSMCGIFVCLSIRRLMLIVHCLKSLWTNSPRSIDSSSRRLTWQANSLVEQAWGEGAQ